MCQTCRLVSSAGSGVVGADAVSGAAFSQWPPSLRVFCICRLRHGLFQLCHHNTEKPGCQWLLQYFYYCFTLGRLHLYTVARMRRVKITAIATMAERNPATPSRSRT